MSLNLNRQVKVAIDGPAGAGKSSVAGEVAKRLGFSYLDTGAMYRAITLKLIRERVSPDDFARVEAVLERTRLDIEDGRRIFLDGEEVTAEIRQPYVNSLVSPVSAIPLVRKRLVEMQREIASRTDGIVMEGRDIATKVMPDAEYCFYLYASPAERARRRQKEQLERGLDLKLGEVLAEIEERDRIDSARDDSPLAIAPGSKAIDTTGLTFDQVVEMIVNIIRGISKSPDGR